MAKSEQVEARKYLKSCNEALEQAREGGDERQIGVAMATVGFALFQTRKYKEGLRMFGQAVAVADKLQDSGLKVQCLGIKALAYHEAERLPDALTTTNEILEIAEAQNNLGMKCDALTSQAQILIDSGEPVIGFSKAKEARQIAREIDDQRRSMNALGVLGNLSLGMAAADQAKDYFAEALELAAALGDQRAQCGFLGNQGAILIWHGKHTEAEDVFNQVLDLATALGDRKAEINALRYLTRVAVALGNHAKTLDYARKGVGLVQGNDNESAFAFYEAIIMACYGMGQFQEAHSTIEEAIALARAAKDFNREVDLLLSLGESYMIADLREQALETYKSALKAAKQLNRFTDEAYLTGRIGVALAELGNIAEAIPYHNQSIQLARQRELPELESEQLSMLAMAYLEQQELDKARQHCQAAIEAYAKREASDGEEKARLLLAQIEAAATVG